MAVPDLSREQLLPPAADASAQLLLDLLYDPLYRLDEHARAPTATWPPTCRRCPRTASPGPSTWRDGDIRFADGSPITAADVAASLRIARSPTCSLGRDLCATALEMLDSVEAVDDRQVRLTLNRALRPVPRGGARRSCPSWRTRRSEAGAAGHRASAAATSRSDAPDKLVTRIYRAVGDDACLVEQPPAGLRPVGPHRRSWKRCSPTPGCPCRPRDAFTNDTGQVDEAAYANELLDRVASLGQVLSRTGTDRLAAALPLHGPRRPVAGQRSVPRRGHRAGRLGGARGRRPVTCRTAGGHPAHLAPGRGRPGGRDDPAACRATWTGSSGPTAQQAAVDRRGDRRCAPVCGRCPSQWTIVFNTREGRLYCGRARPARVRRCVSTATA